MLLCIHAAYRTKVTGGHQGAQRRRWASVLTERLGGLHMREDAPPKPGSNPRCG